MMSAPTTTKDETQGSGRGKNPSAARQSAEQGLLKCPRCDSPNTKFCYYNNYSLTQPRHFCKTCRRYWTKGGALRNVPIGGGCRKNKKVKSSSRLSSSDSKDSGGGGGSFFHHHRLISSSSSCSSSLDFQLGGAGIPLPPFPRLHNLNHQPHLSSSLGEGLAAASSSGGLNLDPSASGSSSSPLIGFNYPFNGGIQGMMMNVQSSLESLSCTNQDLHWKLQQQRLGMLFGGDDSRDHNGAVSAVNVESQISQTQKRQPVLLQNVLEISQQPPDQPQEICAVGGNSRTLPTEWFFGGSSYASATPTPTTASGGDGNDNGSISNNWSTSVHAWGDVQQQYSALP